MNSNIIPRFCLSHSFWRLLFSPLLSNLIYLISIPYLALSSLVHIGIISIWSFFLFKKKLWLQSLNSSTTINRCLFPPILSCLNELMSMNNLHPGLLGTCFSFFFGMSDFRLCTYFTWFKLSCQLYAHIFSCCSQKMFSSTSSHLVEFPDWNTFSWLNHHMCLTHKSLCLYSH